MKDQVKVIGRIQTVRTTETPIGVGWKRDPESGKFTKQSAGKNMVVLAGLSMMAKSIQYGNADQGESLRYLAVGTGFTAPAKGNTALVSETTRAEIDSWDNTGIAADPVVMVASKLFTTAQANGDLMEAALFVAASGAPMFSRGLFGTGNITNATKASTCIVTASGHGLTEGDKILIEAVGGMTELNDNAYFAGDITGTTFGLYTDADVTAPVNSSGYSNYTSGGTWKEIIPKTSSETLTVTYSLTFPVE